MAAEPQDGWAVVPVTEKGREAEVARALLELADEPRDVVWAAGTNEFHVPDALGEAYRKSVSSEEDKPARRTRAKKENSDG